MVVLPHEQFGKWIARVFVSSERERFDGIMLSILCTILVCMLTWLLIKAHKSDRILLLSYSVLTGVFVTLCIKYLFVVNVEAIHFGQYAVFAIICFQLNASYFKTMFWSVIAGAIDEFYQYVVLAPDRTDYYDFNDVVINAVGAGIGLIVIRTLRRPIVNDTVKDLLRTTEMIVAVGMVLLISIAMATGLVSYGPDADAVFCFMKVDDIGFWKKDFHEFLFHVVKPLEGTLLAIALIIFYSGLKNGYERIPQDP